MTTNVIRIDAGTRRRQADLQSRLDDLLRLSARREDLQIEQLADPADQVRSNTERDMAVETLNQQALSIQNIRAALERIEDGCYGCCERCDQQIPAKRLEALPWARLCIKCQSETEAESHPGRTIFHTAA